MKSVTPADYFNMHSNRVNFFHSVIFFIYLPFRMNDMSVVIPDFLMMTNQFNQKALTGWFIIHTVIIVMISLQLSIFMKTNTTFSKMIVLIKQSMIDVIPFTIFLLLWIILTGLMYLVAGTKNYPNEGFETMNVYMATFVQNFYNAIGSIEFPDTSFWKYENRPHIVWRTFLMNIYGVFIFIFNEFAMLIVLLNFVIAVINDTYVHVLAT